MSLLNQLLEAPGVGSPASEQDAEKLAARLSKIAGFDIVPASLVSNESALYAVGYRDRQRMLFVCARKGDTALGSFPGEGCTSQVDGLPLCTLVRPADSGNAENLRGELLFLRPQVIGLKKSFGFGDRLGLATPGHIRAVRGTSMRPFFAQQSMREMSRSGRTPRDVMDDATWAMLEMGWHEGAGSDADHLKSAGDIDVCLEAGFTLFTIDPGAHVDDAADTEAESALKAKFDALPWHDLEATAEDYRKRFLAKPIKISDILTLRFDEERLLRAAAKYARAVVHTAKLYRHLLSKRKKDEFELEVSVDETDSPTSVAEHYFIAAELRRLGVKWSSMAPRFVGRFEKGVDYIGNLREFESAFVQHVDLSHHFGPYKLSLHSGSDKFSVYPIAAKHAGELIHVKTAGTSYLEAIRVIGELDPGLFREILGFGIDRYEEDKKTYHVSADLAKVPRPASLKDDQLADVMDQFDARQVLHVTYGSVLMTKDKSGKPLFRDRLMKTLKGNPEAYAKALEKHLGKHVKPFA